MTELFHALYQVFKGITYKIGIPILYRELQYQLNKKLLKQLIVILDISEENKKCI